MSELKEDYEFLFEGSIHRIDMIGPVQSILIRLNDNTWVVRSNRDILEGANK